jgi:hypothetical protein
MSALSLDLEKIRENILHCYIGLHSEDSNVSALCIFCQPLQQQRGWLFRNNSIRSNRLRRKRDEVMEANGMVTKMKWIESWGRLVAPFGALLLISYV